MSRKYFVILGLFLAAGFLFLNTYSAKAETWTWTGDGDKTSWTDAANWGLAVNSTSSNANSYPGATTTPDVVIQSNTAGGQITARATTSLSINTLTLGGGNHGPTLILGNGKSFGATTTVEVVGTSTLKLGDATWGSGTLNLGRGLNNVFVLPASATFTAATGTMAFYGGSGTVTIATTTYYNLTVGSSTPGAVIALLTVSGQGTTATSTITVSNVLTVNSGANVDFNGSKVVLSGSGTVFSKTNGAFIANRSLVQYTAASATNVATGTYANLDITGAATKTLLGNITVASSTIVGSGATLAISTFTATATGATWTNSGTVTEGTGGKIVLAGAGVLSNSAGGSAVSSFGNFDSYPVIHVQITDTSLNLNAATAETQTATVTGTSGITNSETVTLTETTVSSGIFRGSLAVSLSGSNVAGVLDYQGGGTVKYDWTDSQDSNDTQTASASFTGTTPGGSGGGAVTVVAPAVPATPAVPTVTPAVPAIPAAPAVPSLDNVQTKIASVVAKVAALTKDSPAADIAAVQTEIAAILNDILAIQAASPAPKGVALGFNFVRPLALGLRHNDVKNLQEALKTDSSIYPEGSVTGYFGPATLRAVQKFQEKYGIVSAGTSGYGNVGPKTRTKLNELFGNK